MILVTSGCSNQSPDPATPAIDLSESAAGVTADESRVLWGMWDLYFDGNNMSVTALPDRNLQAHFNVTDMITPPACYDCVIVSVNSFNPSTRILDVDVTLRNPSAISGRDVRGILYTDTQGHLLTNPDAWTAYWDITGGEDINPFRAFAKSDPNRKFNSLAQYTENYLVYIPVPPQYAAIHYAVDASWPGNCREPYAIENFVEVHSPSSTLSSQGKISVDIFDWQDDVNSVEFMVDGVTSSGYIPMAHTIGNTWEGEYKNETGALPGDYTAIIQASSQTSLNKWLYNKFDVTVVESGIPISPIDVTPPWLNFTPYDIAVGDNIVCVAGNMHGLHLFSKGITGLAWLDKVETSGPAYGVDIDSNYAYVAVNTGNLDIVNVDVGQPGGAGIVKTVDLEGSPQKVCYHDGYAYVACEFSGLAIVDVDPIENAHVVVTFPTTRAMDVTVDNGYAFVADESGGLLIIDVSTVDSPFLLTSIDTGNNAEGVDVSGGYAYVANWSGGIAVVDIDPIGSASLITSIGIGTAIDVAAQGNFVFGLTRDTGMSVIDINGPFTVVQTVDPGGWNKAIDIYGARAYIADSNTGIHILDITDPVTASILNTQLGFGWANDVEYNGGYAYVADNHAGLMVVGAYPPPDSFLIGRGDTREAKGLCVEGINAFIADWNNPFNIMDFSDPASPISVETVTQTSVSYDVVTAGGYAFIANDGGGLLIVDIDPIVGASIAKVVPTLDRAVGVVVDSEYAYVADEDGGLQIIDINPIVDASIYNTISTPDAAMDVAIDSGYAYVAVSEAGLSIIDIDPPDMASIVKTVDLPSKAMGVTVSGGYAYLACFSEGIQVVDIDPLNDAYALSNANTLGLALKIDVNDNYAFVADTEGGLRIFQLW